MDESGRWFPERPLRHVPRLVLATLLLFGLALILNTQTAGDGVWYWYARALIDGKRLYADLGFVQQPLYVLVNAWVIRLGGSGWLVSRLPAFLTLTIFLAFSWALIRRGGRSPVEQAVLLSFLFFVGIHFEAYRFDDYHAPVDAICIAVTWLLLGLARAQRDGRFAWSAVVIGALIGIASGLRLTDGAVLLVSSIPLIAVLAPSRRVPLVVATVGAAVAVLCLIVLLSGDGFGDWWSVSIVGAAGAKGGGGGLLLTPLKLPFNAARSLVAERVLLLRLLAVVACAAVVAWPLRVPLAARWTLRAVAIAVGAASLRRVLRAEPIPVASATFVLVAYGLLAVLVWRAARALVRGQPEDLAGDQRFVLLLPIALWMSGALSTGGLHYGLYFAFALFVILLVHTHPGWFDSGVVRVPFFVLLATLAVTSARFRMENPNSWHAYRTAPLFQNRGLIDHPIYGKMYVARDLDAFVAPICKAIDASGRAELLSIPFPFANYYCGTPPWNGWVQSFFDTSSEAAIDRMVRQLRDDPPAWILYQRQLDNLAMHEQIFNAGRPLPHRRLDSLLMERLESGAWSLVNEASRPADGWLLISTGG